MIHNYTPGQHPPLVPCRSLFWPVQKPFEEEKDVAIMLVGLMCAHHSALPGITWISTLVSSTITPVGISVLPQAEELKMTREGKPAAESASAAACASNAYPSGIYGKYKRATDFFLNWLLRARSASAGAASVGVKGNFKREGKPKMTLEVYHEIVMAIAANPTALEMELKMLWSRALAACETAVTLRARIALFFVSSADGNDSHAHFLDRLRTWLEMLQNAKEPVYVVITGGSSYQTKTQMKKLEKETAKVEFTNYYTVLEYYFSHGNGLPATALLDMNEDPKPSLDGKQFSDDTDDDEFYVELSFFFMELEELLEAVHKAFLDVKHRKKTLIEATTITKVAVDCATSVIARLELRHPWIRSADDLMTILDDVMLTPGFKAPWDSVLSGWSASPSGSEQDQQDQYHAYVPGSIVVDFVWASKVLKSFVTAISTTKKNTAVTYEESSLPYDEDRTPHYVWPCMDATEPFFSSQLLLVYNELHVKRRLCQKLKLNTLENWFVSFFDRMITTRTATLPGVFLVMCWAHSVALLQGNGDLRRTTGHSVMHCWELEDRTQEIMPRLYDIMKEEPTHIEMEDYLGELRRFNESTAVLQANPLLGGCVQIDHVIIFQSNSSTTAFATRRLITFAHCYHALLDRQLLAAISVIEDLLQVYETTLFKPSRQTTVYGSYFHSCIASLLDDNALQPASLSYLQLKPRREKRVPKPSEFAFHVISKVSRLLYNRDYAVLPANPTVSESWKALLTAASTVCNEELLGTRLLSRDLFKLSNDMADAFTAMWDVMKFLFRGSSKAYLNKRGQQFLSPQEMNLCAVLELLDSTSCDGRDSTLKVEQVRRKIIVSGKMRARMRRAAEVFSRHFTQRSLQEGNNASFDYHRLLECPTEGESGCEAATRTFDSLMEMLECCSAPLSSENVKRLKNAVKENPELLRMNVKDSTKELCTLLHHATAGPAHDRCLLKWFVQVSAFQQEDLISFTPAQDSDMNMTALHCAAKAGLVDMVRLLLKAGFMRDLNTVTSHTRESLAHLAVKHGHRDLFTYLVSKHADLWTPDAAGNYVHELTDDTQWREEILSIRRIQHQLAATGTDQESQQSQSRGEAAERLQQSLVQYCDEKRAERATLPSRAKELMRWEGSRRAPRAKRRTRRRRRKTRRQTQHWSQPHPKTMPPP